MKRFGNIFNKIYDIDNLEIASNRAMRGKGNYNEVLIFKENKDILLQDLHTTLQNKLYKTSQYEIFKKMCGKKEREIYKLPFYPDRICQWAIMLQVENIFIRNFTKDTYSAIPNRGIRLALKRIQKEIKSDKEGMRYCLKIDIKKYYPNIDHSILKQKLEKLFKDKDLLWLLFEIIDSLPNGKGLPIGNYTSQYLANFNLSSFDHWVKEVKKVKHYFRYMDDMIFFSSNKEDLHQLLLVIKEYLRSVIKLDVKANEQAFPVDSRGVDFVGYVIYSNKAMLRKSIKKKMIYALKKYEKYDKLSPSNLCSINSYGGWLKHCNGINLRNKYIEPLLRKESA